MNNAKASNAIVALADAMASLAQDYEGQLAQLKQSNEALARQLKEDGARLLKTDQVVGQTESILLSILANKEGRNGHSLEAMAIDPAAGCRYLLEQLRQAPCLKPPHPTSSPSDGSPGPLPSTPMSKASTPSASSTG